MASFVYIGHQGLYLKASRLVPVHIEQSTHSLPHVIILINSVFTMFARSQDHASEHGNVMRVVSVSI